MINSTLMKMPDVPEDLVEEILSRVPATSLRRLRFTCKRWNALLKYQRFTEKHFRKAEKQSLVIMLKDYRLCPVSISLNVAPPSIEFQRCLKLYLSSSKQVDILNVFHCDGLLLCITKDNRLVVWNPCLGETKWIKLKTDYKRYPCNQFALGYIQNTKSCRSYKILRWWGNNYDYRFEIYDFSSDSWRVFDDAVGLASIIEYNGYSSGPSSLKGNTYWIAFDEREDYKFLLSFDFTTERFKRLSLPVFQNRGHVTLSVGREEQLSVLNQSYNTYTYTYITIEMEMWVTNRIDAEAELLWSKSFILNIPLVSNAFKIFTTLLIDGEKKVSLCCNLGDTTSGNLIYTIGEDNKYYKETPYINNLEWRWYQEWRPVIFHYVPSLFQIQ